MIKIILKTKMTFICLSYSFRDYFIMMYDIRHWFFVKWHIYLKTSILSFLVNMKKKNGVKLEHIYNILNFFNQLGASDENTDQLDIYSFYLNLSK